MKLMTMTQVTVDGVMQGNGGATDEDRRSGFERGGWAIGVADDETMTFINQTYQRADAFLSGPDIALDLVDSRADSKGVTIQVYRPNGRPHYRPATAD